MTGLPILSILLLVPMLGAGACLFLWPNGARWGALVATLVDLLLGAWLWSAYQVGGPQWQFVEGPWSLGLFSYALGIDGISLMLIMLSLFLMPICILASWRPIERRVQEYMAAFLIME